MSQAATPPPSSPAQPSSKSMDDIVALCRRRGFIFQSSEIYGGINGFWDYGPLGAELKRNLKNAWWQDMIHGELIGPTPAGKPLDIVPLDCTIIMNPKVWEASGHVGGFNDPMVDDKETKQRFRADHLWTIHVALTPPTLGARRYCFVEGDEKSKEHAFKQLGKYLKRTVSENDPDVVFEMLTMIPKHELTLENIVAPLISTPGTLTEPRQFNLMFETYVGALQSEESKAYLRPETAQGIFVNFWNVVDTSRVKVPFGIAQQGKAFRNEVTPRNFTFRSREFEQMEIEFFCHPDQSMEWFEFWRQQRMKWWESIGLAGDNLRLYDTPKKDLAHYAGAGADVEYRFPFTAPGFGELEGIAHRADFDLKAHATACGKGDKLQYFDQDLQVKLQAEGVSKEEIQKRSRYFPHVIEPSAGADRGALAILCEAYTPDGSRPSGVFMKFHPRMAPIKAAVFPLVNKDGMPEVAEKLYRKLRTNYVVQFDEKQSIGKRYARMDEAGTPFCFTIDGDTLKDQTVTVRHRDSQQQERIALDRVSAFMTEKVGG